MSTRVLHLINGEFYAGAERVQDLLAARLPEFGYDVGFVCLKDGVFAKQRAATAAPVEHFPMKSKVDFRYIAALAKFVRDGGFRLIHTHTGRTALIGQLVSWRTGLPMIHHVHSPTARDTESAWRNFRNSLVERMSLMRAAKLIAVSASLEGQLRDRGVDRGKVRLVSNGVPVRDKGRLDFGGREPLVVGTVALFRPRKGIEVLLRALARVRADGLDVKLRAIGPFETPRYEESVRRLAAELGLDSHVHWTGFTRDVFGELAQTHLFALPSLYGEGMPMVVLEAMAAGLPIVSTDVEGIPEVVRDGTDGLIARAGSDEDLADALRKAATGQVDLAKLGDSGWLRQRDEFSDLTMARRVADVYREVKGGV